MIQDVPILCLVLWLLPSQQKQHRIKASSQTRKRIFWKRHNIFPTETNLRDFWIWNPSRDLWWVDSLATARSEEYAMESSPVHNLAHEIRTSPICRVQQSGWVWDMSQGVGGVTASVTAAATKWPQPWKPRFNSMHNKKTTTQLIGKVN
jgi:hypothetical protein